MFYNYSLTIGQAAHSPTRLVMKEDSVIYAAVSHTNIQSGAELEGGGGGGLNLRANII